MTLSRNINRDNKGTKSIKKENGIIIFVELVNPVVW